MFVRQFALAWRQKTARPHLGISVKGRLLSSPSKSDTPSSSSMHKGDTPKEGLSFWQRFMLGLLPYRLGFRKLGNNVKVAYHLLSDSILDLNRKLTRRERRLVLRTVFDITKLLPFAAIAAAPGGSMLLPVLARFFPSSLPTTFNVPSREELGKAYQGTGVEAQLQGTMDSHLKRAMSKIVSTMHENQVRENTQLHELLTRAMEADSHKAFDRLRLMYVKYSDEDLLDVLNFDQLASLGRYFNRTSTFLETMASDRYRFSILRYNLSKHLSRVSSEDVLLAEESPDSLSDGDLVQACLDRGLIKLEETVSRPEMLLRLQDWLMASVGHHLPVVLIAFANMK